MSSELEVALDNDDFRISYQRGASGTAVVSFTGANHSMGSIQTEEFRRSLGQLGHEQTADVVYVTDKQRKWYNEGLRDKILDAINNLLKTFEARRVIALGNSMGGFGAIHFANGINGCKRVISFSPQSSVMPEIVPFERRYLHWTSNINWWTAVDAVPEVRPEIEYEMFFGGDEPTDMLHAERFASVNLANARLYFVPNCGHGVAKRLRAHGVLLQVLDHLIWTEERPSEVIGLLEAGGIRARTLS